MEDEHYDRDAIYAEIHRRADEITDELMRSGFDGEFSIMAQTVAGKIARVEFTIKGEDGRETRRFYIPGQ